MKKYKLEVNVFKDNDPQSYLPPTLKAKVKLKKDTFTLKIKGKTKEINYEEYI